MNNYKKIKQMSLDEMADTLTFRVIGGMSAFILLNAKDILNCIKQWLQEESL